MARDKATRSRLLTVKVYKGAKHSFDLSATKGADGRARRAADKAALKLIRAKLGR